MPGPVFPLTTTQSDWLCLHHVCIQSRNRSLSYWVLTQLYAGPSIVVRFQSPSQPQRVNQAQSQEPHKSQKPEKPQETEKPEESQEPEPSKKKPGNGDDLDPDVVKLMVDAALESIKNGGPGMPAIGSPFEMIAQWPEEYCAADEKVEKILAERQRAAAPSAEPMEDYYDDDEPQDPPSKRLKLKHSR